jgi:hypothetical protein
MAVYGCIWVYMVVHGCLWLFIAAMVVHCCHGCLVCSCRSCPLVVAMDVMSFMPVRGCNGSLWLSRSFWSFMAIHGCSWLPWLFIAAMVAMDGPGHPIHHGRPAHYQLFLALRCACGYPLIYLPAWNHTPSYGLGPSAIAGLGPIDLRTVWDHRLSHGGSFLK